MVSVFLATVSVMVQLIALMAAMKMTVVSSPNLCGSFCWVVVPVGRRIQLKVMAAMKMAVVCYYRL